MSNEKYGVIAEWKEQAPIILEAEDQTLDGARNLYSLFLKRQDVVRVCLVRLIYVIGNRDLCPVGTERDLHSTKEQEEAWIS